jgi:hypothetical protein
MDISSLDPIIVKALDLVYSSTRSMPAHFTSNDDRKQTFLVEFDPLTVDADHELASEAWYGTDKFFTIETGLSRSETNLAVICGEDVILGSFIVTKLGKSELTKDVKEVIIKSAIDKLHTQSSDINVFFNKLEVISYLDYCEKRGREIAETISITR